MKKNSTLFIRYAMMAAGLVGLVLLGGMFVVYNHRQHLTQDVKIYRYALAQEAEALRQTYNQLISISNLLVKNPVVINSLDRHLNGQEATEIATGMVDRNLEAIAAIENVSSVFLVSLDGACLYSSQKEQVGKNYSESNYVRNTLRTGSGLYAMMNVASGRTGLYYAQAIKNGSLRIGVAVLEIRPSFFYLHSFTTPFTEETPQSSDVRIGLSTDSNILLNTTEGSLVSIQPLPDDFLPKALPPQSVIQSLDFPNYNKEALISSGFLKLKSNTGSTYYFFHQAIVSRSLSLIHIISKDWFHRNYHPASSDYSGYLIMLGGMLSVMLGLLWMVNRRHSQVLLAAETLKNEAEQRIVDKEKYEAIINRNPQGFWLNDFTTGIILEVNQSLCQLLGLEAEDIVGHYPDEFIIRSEEENTNTYTESRYQGDISCEGKLRLRSQVANVLINSSCILVPGYADRICFSFFADISERKKEQEQLFLFSQAVEQSTSAIVITDQYACIAYVNSAFTELTGWSRDEIHGTDPALLTAGERDTALSQEIWQKITNGGTWKGFLLGRKKDGSTYWEGQTVCPLYDDKGRITYYLAIKNDITQRLELERKFKAQLAKLELMVEHAAIGIAHVVEHQFAWASRAAVEMFGYTDWEDIASLPLAVIFENEEAHQNTLRLSQELFAQDQIFHADQQMRRRDGSLFWCSLTGKIIDPLAPEQGAVWLTKDISRQKEEERQLQLAKERAEQANQAKNDFLANISHEIRTPMNAILGMSDLALKSNLNEEQQKYITTVNEAAASLMGLLNDILDFSKIESPSFQLEPAPFKLERTVNDAVQTFKYPAEKKGLCLRWVIEPDVPAFVEGDALRLQQILVKLLNNSIKFSEQGRVVVRVAVQERDAENIVLMFQVSDKGIGIAKDKQETIFDLFVQVDTSLRRENSGTGLGLTICRKLCELMGGTISVESELGQGSVFTFTARLKNISGETAAEMEDVVNRIGTLRVLVVDDNKANRFLATTMLQRDRHQIVEANDGVEALNMLLHHQFDLVLMDVQMPIMDGLAATKIIRACEQESCCLSGLEMPEEFCEELHRRLKGSHLLIVALTANNVKEDKHLCLAAGMDAYNLKPLAINDIYRTVQQLYCHRKNALSSSVCMCMAEQ
ncbi:MAG: PAS domain S-box-containing protein [Candidatus Electronema aureum]|uniref:histidine kinase n=1 Tax=Candidatus Electronema aureum TaxID=2005002 RepID=A0A521G2B9_9BACT|nr:MAG: PAS domain S-box-containing protein [Candidatus Electronema aureum]